MSEKYTFNNDSKSQLMCSDQGKKYKNSPMRIQIDTEEAIQEKNERLNYLIVELPKLQEEFQSQKLAIESMENYWQQNLEVKYRLFQEELSKLKQH